MSKPEFQDWGLINYQTALNKQLELVDLLHKNSAHPGFFIFCTHPPVVTTGRQTKPEDVFSWKGEIIEISRGGRATYHGPSQLVVYPILNLKNPRAGRGPQEVRGYLRAFEQAIVET
ncbi:MAG: octanoyltransferase, partial [Bdellovibrionales bacterium]